MREQSEDDDMPDDARIESLEHKISETIEEAVVALGITPTGWAWRCDGCGESVLPDRNFGHRRGVDEHCGPVGIAPEFQVEAWAAVLEAIRAKRAAVGVLGWFVAGSDRNPFVAVGRLTPQIYDKRSAEVLARALNSDPELCREIGSDAVARRPFRAVPVGPVAELRITAYAVADKDGEALPQHCYASDRRARSVADRLNQCSSGFSGLSGAPFSVLTLYASPPDRPAEAVELAPAETDLAHSEGRAGDWSVAPGGVEGETGQPKEWRTIDLYGPSATGGQGNVATETVKGKR